MRERAEPALGHFELPTSSTSYTSIELATTLASIIMATAYFYHQAEYQLAICKECRHAVWPDQITSHLEGGHHRLGWKHAESAGDEVRGWNGLIAFLSKLEVPAQVQQPIPELPLFEDRLLCQKDPSNCRYICRNEKVMKKHWRISY